MYIYNRSETVQKNRQELVNLVVTGPVTVLVTGFDVDTLVICLLHLQEI